MKQMAQINHINQKIGERVQRIEHALFGNGSIGITEQIRELRDEQKSTRKEIKKLQRLVVYLIVLVTISLGDRAYEIIKMLKGL